VNAFSNLKETGLAGKVVIITGGAQGIGLATARRFRAEDSQVVIVDLKTQPGDEVALELGATFMPLDVTDEAAVNAMAEEVFAKYGRIDVLVNNAGITADGKMVSIDKATGELKFMSLDRWDRVMDVNLRGAFICSQAVLRYMVPARSGCLLFASSIVATSGNAGQGNYGASKAGLLALMKAYARELGKFGIRSNAVLPGFTETSMLDTVPKWMMDAIIDGTPMGRLVDPRHIANAYANLAGDQSASTTGSSVAVDCGFTL